MYTLMVETKFASAHQLRGYKGKCENLHGHSWKVQAVVSADALNDLALAMDFSDLKRITNEIVAPLDHACLNSIPPFTEINPSSENLARWVFESLKPKVAEYRVRVRAVTIWESDSASATYTED
jgi:6-pyruvoyltetrahydropterin/6-carboxytetrahydropterin synthase